LSFYYSERFVLVHVDQNRGADIDPMMLVAFRALFACLRHRGRVHSTCIRASQFQNVVAVTVAGHYQYRHPFFLISWGEQTIDSAVASVLTRLCRYSPFCWHTSYCVTK
jgi:hypothetical protein